MSERPLRVGIVYYHHLLAKTAGGVLAYVRGLIEHAPETRFVYWGPEPTPDTAEQPLPPNVEYHTLYRRRAKRGQLIPEYARILAACLRHRRAIFAGVDVLFFHDPILTLPFLPLRRAPGALVIHGRGKRTAEESASFGPWRTRLLALAERLAVGSLARVVLISQQALADYRQRFPAHRERFRLLPTFADDRMLCALPREAAKARFGAAGRPVAAYAGRLQAGKRVDHALRAFQRVTAARPDALFLIAGDGPDRPALEMLAAELNLGSSVRFLGPLTRAEVGVLLRAAEVNVLLTEFEGNSLALLEGLASGAPIVASDVADHRRIITDGQEGFVVPDHDPERVAGRMLEIIAAFDAFSARARRTGEQYLASRVVPQVIALLRAVASRD